MALMKVLEEFEGPPILVDPDAVAVIRPAGRDGTLCTLLFHHGQYSVTVKGHMLDVARALERF